MKGSGGDIEFAGTLAAKLLVTGGGLDAEPVPEGSGQREATTVDGLFASGVTARGVSFNAGAGQGVFGPSFRLVCGGSSARASATDRCITASAWGAGCSTDGAAFWGLVCWGAIS
jgi:hypothetical protein